ncbi:Beta-barrel assembly-enhancing protease [bacterium HR40]|nr:Beta-barrel assembly-enhancing protease [bacterium HR40]
MHRKQFHRTFATLLVIVGLLAQCAEVPETGRSQLVLLPESEDLGLGLNAWRQLLKERKISTDPELDRRVREVGSRIARVSPRPDWPWEFRVFEDDDPNAFALPGGKVGVHTGLFKVAKNDAQLAAVLAHEIAHAVARHGVERMSREMLLSLGVAGLGAAVGDERVAAGAGVAATLLISLPFSREQEAEADEIGLLYMARAGYDPREALRLWENFAAFGSGPSIEFLSTHPSYGSRIARLQRLMPRALAEYERRHRG